MNPPGLPVGLVGCGRWGKNILRDLVTLGCRVAVVAPCAASRTNAVQGGAALIVERVEELPAVAGIVVASPAATHAGVLKVLLPRCVPIFCEKPLTINVPAARWFAANAAGRLFVMDKWRYHPGILELGRIARSGELGQVRGLHTNRLGWNIPQEDVDCSWTLLPHELTIALEILGHVPRPRQAWAERAADGSLLGLTALLGDAVWHRTAIGIRGPVQRRSVEVLGSEGSAVLLNSDSDHVLLIRRPSQKTNLREPVLERRPIAGEQPLLAELRAFLNHLEGGPAPRSSVAEAATVVETIEQLRCLAGLSRDLEPNLAA